MATVRLTRFHTYGAISTGVSLWTILYALRERSNFYSAMIFLSKNMGCSLVLWNQAAYQVILLAKIMQRIFFGELRLIETERLQERVWFAVTETLLTVTIFKDSFDTGFLVSFGGLLLLFKVFHWLAGDRVELMEQTPNLPRFFHFRMVSLLSMLFVLDASFLLYTSTTFINNGPAILIMFASEYMILLTLVWSIAMKYSINLIDNSGEERWEGRAVWVGWVDIITDLLKLATYCTIFCVLISMNGLPLNILRDTYLTFRSLVIRIRDMRRWKQATKDMQERYANASREDLERGDPMCIICREEMTIEDTIEGATPAEQRRQLHVTPKKLPCGHIFHFQCLKSWLERQQSCPTCRRSVLEQTTQPQPTPPNPNPVQPAPEEGPERRTRRDPLPRNRMGLARNIGPEAVERAASDTSWQPEGELAPPRNSPSSSVRRPRTPQLDGFGQTPTSTPPMARGTRFTTSVNPLTKFNLPSFLTPPTGEAGLYQPPFSAFPHAQQHSQSMYMGVAYGASNPNQSAYDPHHQNLNGNTRAMNLEERMSFLRDRSAPQYQGRAVYSESPVIHSSPNSNNLTTGEYASFETPPTGAESSSRPRPGTPTVFMESTFDSGKGKSRAVFSEEEEQLMPKAETTTQDRDRVKLIPIATALEKYPFIQKSISDIPAPIFSPDREDSSGIHRDMDAITRKAVQDRLKIIAQFHSQLEEMAEKMRNCLEDLPLDAEVKNE